MLLRGFLLKLDSVIIKNFRNINDLILNFSDFNVLVGENNIGKTNILMAIYKILKMNESPYRVRFSEEDFYFDKNTNTRSEKIIIQLNFMDLTENDEAAFVSKGIDIKNNCLSLKLEAVWDEDNNDAKVEIFFFRQDDPDNNRGELLKLVDKKYIPFYYIDAYRDIWKETQHSKGDLKQIFKDYNKNFLKPLEIQKKISIKRIEIYLSNEDSIDPKISDSLNRILKRLKNDEIDQNQADLDNIPINLDKLKKSLSNMTKKREINENLIKIESIINTLEGIEDIKNALKDNLSLFVPGIDDLTLEVGKIEESDLLKDNNIYFDNSPILKQGSGFQNSFVIALKLSRLLANIKFSEENITNLIVAIEEPEAHMHPHLQRSFIKKLKKKHKQWLVDYRINVQFVITTHSPFILSQVDKAKISLIKKANNAFQVTRLNNDFIKTICADLSEDKLKHFDTIFRTYPEIFLSRGVIIVEGQSEFGAIPEMAQKIPDIDLDELGLTLIHVEGKRTLKPVYLILKKFTQCVAIRDNDEDDNNNDEDLIDDENEPYYKTDLKDFEEEIISSVPILSIVKNILMGFYSSDNPYLNLVYQHVPESRDMVLEEILEKWETELNLENLELNLIQENLVKTLKNNKNALFWSIFCSNINESEVPSCYKKLIIKAKDLVV